MTLAFDEGEFGLLEVLHHITSGLKAVLCDYQSKACDEMRQACGGAGYHIASGVATNYLNNAHLSIVEGAYAVMIQ